VQSGIDAQALPRHSNPPSYAVEKAGNARTSRHLPLHLAAVVPAIRGDCWTAFLGQLFPGPAGWTPPTGVQRIIRSRRSAVERSPYASELIQRLIERIDRERKRHWR